MISQSTIDTIFETARVEEVIGEFVQLKKSGSNFKGLSPFTEEKTPSFMVSPAKQIWKDFSSGKGGNVVSFLMEQEHYTYPEALRWLAKKYNIEIEEIKLDDEQKQILNERESMYLVSEFARDYFHDILLNNEQGKVIGLSYFKERGYREETIKKFQLGYALNEWEIFTKHALEKGYDLKVGKFPFTASGKGNGPGPASRRRQGLCTGPDGQRRHQGSAHTLHRHRGLPPICPGNGTGGADPPGTVSEVL